MSIDMVHGDRWIRLDLGQVSSGSGLCRIESMVEFTLSRWEIT